MRRVVKATVTTVLVVAVLFGLMQAVPYGRTHANPTVTREPAWDSPRTRELAVRACFDCHSNETTWPWYANVAPMSWVVERDVDTARTVVNFSQWDVPYALASYSGSSLKYGGMPPTKYRLAHPLADLTPTETAELVRGLDATIGK